MTWFWVFTAEDFEKFPLDGKLKSWRTNAIGVVYRDNWVT